MIVTDPPGGHVELDGKPVDGETPMSVATPRSFLADGSFELSLAEDGYETTRVTLKHVWDPECVRNDAFEALLLGPLLLLPVVKLFHMPWCSHFESPGYEFVLVPLDTPAPSPAP